MFCVLESCLGLWNLWEVFIFIEVGRDNVKINDTEEKMKYGGRKWDMQHKEVKYIWEQYRIICGNWLKLC